MPHESAEPIGEKEDFGAEMNQRWGQLLCALGEVAAEVLRSSGHVVEVRDLYAECFNSAVVSLLRSAGLHLPAR